MFRMRLEAMKATVVKSVCCFKIISCCRVKNRDDFMKEHKIGALKEDEIDLTSKGMMRSRSSTEARGSTNSNSQKE